MLSNDDIFLPKKPPNDATVFILY